MMETVIDKLWLLEGGQISAASVLDWYQNNFYQGDSYETIDSPGRRNSYRM